MDRERRVPDRRQARLAIGFVPANDKQPLDRSARGDEMGMVGRVAERVEHQHRVRHGGIDCAETVLAVEPLRHESHGGVDGLAARRLREERFGELEQLVDDAEELGRRPGLMRARWPVAYGLGRRHEEFRNLDASRIGGARLEGLQRHERHEHGARPVGDLVEMEGEPARQKHDLDRHGRDAAPGDGAVEREQGAREDIAPRGAASCEDGFARAAHMQRLRIVADHFQGEIALDAGAHVERAGVEQRPTAVSALDASDIDADQPFQFEIRLFAPKVPEQHIFGGDRDIRLKFEAPMSVAMLTRSKRLRRQRYLPLERVKRRRVLLRIESDVHEETPAVTRARRGEGRISARIEAAL